MTFKRKRYIVDKKFQLGLTFTVIGASFLVVAIVIALMPYIAKLTNDKMSRVIDDQDRIVQALVAHAGTLDAKMKSAESALAAAKADKAKLEANREESPEAKTADKTKKKKSAVIKKAVPSDEITVPEIREEKPEIEIGKIAKTHLSNISELREMVAFNTKLLWTVVVLIIAQGVILFFILILKTHRIAGPVYVMSGYLREIISGKVPASLRPLRKYDDLKNLYLLFGQMVDTLKSGRKLTVAKATAPKAVTGGKSAKKTIKKKR
ncbi:MAG TPA: hypothetical protein PKK43_05725 [Spirochaetota bacterium]|nr:hypothetical protein [Spirochaetota bacterium]